LQQAWQILKIKTFATSVANFKSKTFATSMTH
jgi:hypothetical protein